MGIGFDKSKGGSNKPPKSNKRKNSFDLDSGLKTVNKKPTPSQKYKDEEEDYYVPDDLYDDDFEDLKPKRRQYQEPQKKSKSGLIIVIMFFIILCLLVVGFFLIKDKNTSVDATPSTNQSLIPDADDNTSKQPAPNNTQKEPDDSSASGTLIKENPDGTTSEITNGTSTGTNNSVTPGLPNFNVNTNMNSDSPVTDYSKFTNTLDGKQVDVNFKVSRIETKQDFVNYTKYRAVTGTGLELYWLEVTYKNIPYKITVPFKIYKELDNVGIVPVTMEVLVLSDNSQIISYMEVNTEYKGDAK